MTAAPLFFLCSGGRMSCFLISPLFFFTCPDCSSPPLTSFLLYLLEQREKHRKGGHLRDVGENSSVATSSPSQ
ncbi:hypothetical protein Hdeb2414_s0007g00248521 [Helianthus debilis subsp. tardiflorus]